ncbi:MAG TPA: peptidase domain-containing ABC transporter [Usitatibacteraceae bacterium]|nr:peptidase domain-containing ABC transporter [Usitatibacteraceae bacterium]
MFGRRVPVILQSEAPECGIACIAMVASYHGHLTDLSAMRLRLSPSLKGVTLKHIAQVAESMGLATRGVQVPLEGLGKLQLPAVLHWDMNHFVVLTKLSGKHIYVHDPARGKRKLTLAEASRHFTGVAMEFTPNQSFRRTDEREKISAWQLLPAGRGLGGTVFQLVVLSLALEVFAIAMPFFLQLVVDRVLVGRDVDFLTVIGLAFAALVMIQVLVSAVRAVVGVYLSTHFNLRMLTVLFNHLLRLPLGWFEKRNIGDIVSKFRSVDAIQKTLTTNFVETFIDGVMVVVTLGVMAFYSLKLTAVVVGAALIYALLRWYFFYPQRYATDEQLAHEAKANTHFIETLRGMMALKLNMRENERRGAYQNLVVEQINAAVKVQHVGIWQRAANGLVFGLENVIVVWLAALLVMDGKFSVGMLYAFLGFKLVFLTRVNNLIDKWNEFRMLDLHAERIADIALAEAENIGTTAVAAAESIEPVTIEARNLGFAYGPEGYVFRNVNLDIRPGERLAIVGPSGCGKTTLLKVLLGLLQPTEGQVLVNGRDLRDWDLGHYRARIAAVMQDDQLFIGTIEDNVSFFDPDHDPERVRECARLAQVDAEIANTPMGYNTIVGSLGMSLSGGQKQRVMLARALYRRPQVLFLDETLDQVDTAQELAIREGVAPHVSTTVFVSHRPESVGEARVIKLSTN